MSAAHKMPARSIFSLYQDAIAGALTPEFKAAWVRVRYDRDHAHPGQTFVYENTLPWTRDTRVAPVVNVASLVQEATQNGVRLTFLTWPAELSIKSLPKPLSA